MSKVDIDLDKLFSEALKASDFAYAPYSKFRVGAALLADDGEGDSIIITGVNVENRSFGLTICAERSAVVKAISIGLSSFKALAVSTPDSVDPVGPCGACRQVLSEFMAPDAKVIFGGSGKEKVITTVGELYPFDSLHDLGSK
ncbi:MAG: cytidine deaminase [Treponema sp.]|nr:cytidine deaminase [Treponema sp.]